MDQLLDFFQNEFLIFMKEKFPCDKEWHSFYSPNNPQVDIRGCNAIYLKKELGKGDVYRFRVRGDGLPSTENDLLFQRLLEMITNNSFDCLLEYNDNLYSTGENSKETLELFNEFKKLTKGFKTSNHLSAFSFGSSLPFISYKYNVKLFPDLHNLQIYSSFKGDGGKNYTHLEYEICTTQDIQAFMENYEDEISYIEEKLDDVSDFIKSLDSKSTLSKKKKCAITLFKKVYQYSLSKHDKNGYSIIFRHNYLPEEKIHVDTLDLVFEKIKAHIDQIAKSDRLDAIMESRT